jgi:hypothetical protein
MCNAQHSFTGVDCHKAGSEATPIWCVLTDFILDKGAVRPECWWASHYHYPSFLQQALLWSVGRQIVLQAHGRVKTKKCSTGKAGGHMLCLNKNEVIKH